MGYVYIYRSGDGNVFKIGKAKDVGKRIKTHATGNPEPLTEFDVIETEHYVQVRDLPAPPAPLEAIHALRGNRVVRS